MYAAIVTGPNGQDGSYMCELLEEKGYHLIKFQGDVRNYDEVYDTIKTCMDFERTEVYNLAAKIHGCSPTDTFQVNTLGILNIMEAVKNTGMKSKYRIFQASSSEIFEIIGKLHDANILHAYPKIFMEFQRQPQTL